ncbi:MAG: RnfABCDGE type electron transport complex subunit B, partial [Burkholderiales bacterium]|nr:RnfABCDGE type electron transport complex subunit B [Burkholderiales bacterium]
MVSPPPRLADLIEAALPQTQCTRCGYPDCRAYAEAIAAGEAGINRCPPGGAEGIARLAKISGRPVEPLDTGRGHEVPRALAVIDEDWCIGCTLCIKACPVDCIAMLPVTGERSGWSAWSAEQADEARQRYAWHRER